MQSCDLPPDFRHFAFPSSIGQNRAGLACHPDGLILSRLHMSKNSVPNVVEPGFAQHPPNIPLAAAIQTVLPINLCLVHGFNLDLPVSVRNTVAALVKICFQVGRSFQVADGVRYLQRTQLRYIQLNIEQVRKHFTVSNRFLANLRGNRRMRG